MSQHSITIPTGMNEWKPPQNPAASSCPVQLEGSDQQKQKGEEREYSWRKKEQFENRRELSAQLLTSDCGEQQAILLGDIQG